jgi:hypothetical protein
VPSGCSDFARVSGPTHILEQRYYEGSEMTTTAPPIALTGSQLGKVPHISPFFSNDDEEFQALLPFVQHALEFGDKAVHGVNHQIAMLIGGTRHPNPFLLPSAEFLREYQQPRA